MCYVAILEVPRNRLVFGEDPKEWRTIFHEGIMLAMDYNEANRKRSSLIELGVYRSSAHCTGGNITQNSWRRPAGRTLKLNCTRHGKSRQKKARWGWS
ncbi:hypothetical protein LIER_32182 [Lithospermum erythrorhizon]|uniref:Uncharacterized protein n=1 Tax=Lithospermum erythrorhizon TaxID=34254 RepID=A0AAV3RWR9_LITER